MADHVLPVVNPGSKHNLHLALQAIPSLMSSNGTPLYGIHTLNNGDVYVSVPESVNIEPVVTTIANYDRNKVEGELTFTEKLAIDKKLRTTNATATEIFRATLRNLTLYVAQLRLLAVDAGNGNAKYMEARVIVKRLAGGALMVGNPEVPVNISDPGADPWTVTAPVSGNDFIIRVTGAVGRNIDWKLQGTVESFTPQGI